MIRSGLWQPEAWPDTSALPTFAEMLIAHAKLAGIPQAKIVNYWPEKKFLEWAAGAWDR